MNDRWTFSLVLPLLLCLVAANLLLVSSGRPSLALAAVDRYVAPRGRDAGDCTLAKDPCRTVQYAVDVAGPGDVIKFAAGLYDYLNNHGGLSQVVYISKTLIIQGGYAAGFVDPPSPRRIPR